MRENMEFSSIIINQKILKYILAIAGIIVNVFKLLVMNIVGFLGYADILVFFTLTVIDRYIKVLYNK